MGKSTVVRGLDCYVAVLRQDYTQTHTMGVPGRTYEIVDKYQEGLVIMLGKRHAMDLISGKETRGVPVCQFRNGYEEIAHLPASLFDFYHKHTVETVVTTTEETFTLL